MLGQAANNGTGVFGDTSQGETYTGGIGVQGYAKHGKGVYGIDQGLGQGVVGVSVNDTGVVGLSNGATYPGRENCGVYADAGPGQTAVCGAPGGGEHPGYGVIGETTGGTGLTGTDLGSGIGVIGTGVNAPGTGVIGLVGTNAGQLAGEARGVGVYGEADGGIGVKGVDDSTGTGVYAQSASGAALAVHGKATFTRSGLLTIPAGQKSAATAAVPGGLASGSHVLATKQTPTTAAISVESAVPSTSTGKITIYLTANAPSGGVKVAWFVVA